MQPSPNSDLDQLLQSPSRNRHGPQKPGARSGGARWDYCTRPPVLGILCDLHFPALPLLASAPCLQRRLLLFAIWNADGGSLRSLSSELGAVDVLPCGVARCVRLLRELKPSWEGWEVGRLRG